MRLRPFGSKLFWWLLYQFVTKSSIFTLSVAINDLALTAQQERPQFKCLAWFQVIQPTPLMKMSDNSVCILSLKFSAFFRHIIKEYIECQ